MLTILPDPLKERFISKTHWIHIKSTRYSPSAQTTEQRGKQTKIDDNNHSTQSLPAGQKVRVSQNHPIKSVRCKAKGKIKTVIGNESKTLKMATAAMARGRKKSATTIAPKSNHMDTESDEQEYTALSRKLQSKVEALKIMRYELEKCRTERDQFKLMAETIQLRYSAIKNSLNAPDFQAAGFGNSSAVSLLVKQTRERNEALTTEVESLKQRLYDLEGDIKVVRARNVELQDTCGKLRATNESLLSANGDKTWQAEKSQLIAQLEQLRKRNAQLQYDFRSLLDEKEETVTERDAYKCKAHRLNHELNVALRGAGGAGGASQTLLDIDGLILENKYQAEKIANIENELSLARQAASKYKSMLETNRKKGIIKLGTNNNNKTIMSHSQVKHLLENGTVDELPLKAATISDLKSLCLALLDNVNDKSLALSHQKKTNKLLATKIAELERHIKTLAGCDDRATMASLSPSQYLLNGYSSATVDHHQEGEIIVRHARETSDHTLDPVGPLEGNSSSGPSHSGQRTEPLSSSSNKSCVLSCSDEEEEEDDDVVAGRCTGDSATTNTSNAEELQAAIAQLVASVERELSADEQLPQLPDDIAALIEQFKEASSGDCTS
uniref:Coiled-coil domain-containing protein 149 n=2 Tax=Anopheles merus TaxID=30066 RepID=A0A182V3H4_ANOME